LLNGWSRRRWSWGGMANHSAPQQRQGQGGHSQHCGPKLFRTHDLPFPKLDQKVVPAENRMISGLS
jgi:hypothetical protein